MSDAASGRTCVLVVWARATPPIVIVLQVLLQLAHGRDELGPTCGWLQARGSRAIRELRRERSVPAGCSTRQAMSESWSRPLQQRSCMICTIS